MLKDGQVWVNGKVAAKIEQHEKPKWKCILFRKNQSELKFMDVLEGSDEVVLNKISEHNLKLSDKSIHFV